VCNNSLFEVNGAENVPGLKQSAEDTGYQMSDFGRQILDI